MHKCTLHIFSIHLSISSITQLLVTQGSFVSQGCIRHGSPCKVFLTAKKKSASPSRPAKRFYQYGLDCIKKTTGNQYSIDALAYYYNIIIRRILISHMTFDIVSIWHYQTDLIRSWLIWTSLRIFTFDIWHWYFSYDTGGFSDYLSNQKMTVSQS